MTIAPAFPLRHYTLTVPSVSNDGDARPDHLLFVRARLLEEGITGWTEVSSVGYWRGRAEAGHVLTFYLRTRDALDRVADALAVYARQEAVQVTAHGDIVLTEHSG